MLKLGLVALLISQLAFAAKPGGPTHPLDPLSSDEAARALAVLKKSGKLGASSLFPYFMLEEPAKKDVLAFDQTHQLRRQARALVFDRARSKLSEARIDLMKNALVEWQEIPGAQPSVMLSEFDDAPKIVKAD